MMPHSLSPGRQQYPWLVCHLFSFSYLPSHVEYLSHIDTALHIKTLCLASLEERQLQPIFPIFLICMLPRATVAWFPLFFLCAFNRQFVSPLRHNHISELLTWYLCLSSSLPSLSLALAITCPHHHLPLPSLALTIIHPRHRSPSITPHFPPSSLPITTTSSCQRLRALASATANTLGSLLLQFSSFPLHVLACLGQRPLPLLKRNSKLYLQDLPGLAPHTSVHFPTGVNHFYGERICHGTLDTACIRWLGCHSALAAPHAWWI